jgi:hypothetical protein
LGRGEIDLEPQKLVSVGKEGRKRERKEGRKVEEGDEGRKGGNWPRKNQRWKGRKGGRQEDRKEGRKEGNWPWPRAEERSTYMYIVIIYTYLCIV